MQTGWQCKD